MKNRIIFVAFIFFVIHKINAQNDVDLTELKSPSSPAFTILGIQPSEISRPKTYEAVEASLYNSFTNKSNFIFPNNYSLEFSPYWLISHPNLTFDNYINPTIGKNVIYNSSFSLGTIQDKNTSDTTLTDSKIGIGYRTLIFSGKALEKKKKLLADNKRKTLADRIIYNQEIITNASLILNDVTTDPLVISTDTLIVRIKRGSSRIIAQLNDKPEEIIALNDLIDDFMIPLVKQSKASNHEEIMNIVKKYYDRIDSLKSYKIIKSTTKELLDIDKDNVGFFLEFAIAMIVDFPSSKFNHSKIPKWGIWLTPTYRLENQIFEFTGVFRYIRNEVPDLFSDNFDFGGKITFQKNKFSLSGEIIQRYQRAIVFKEQKDDIKCTLTKSKSDIKAVLNFDYKISEKVILSYAFGEGFTINTEFDENLISLFSLNYGIGGPKVSSIKDL